MLRTVTRPLPSTVTLMQNGKPAAAKNSDHAAVKDIYLAAAQDSDLSDEQHSCPDAEQ